MQVIQNYKIHLTSVSQNMLYVNFQNTYIQYKTKETVKISLKMTALRMTKQWYAHTAVHTC